MHPVEQMAGFACHASDLYALGVTCARLITGCLPVRDVYGQIHDRLFDPMSCKWLWREILKEKGITISEDLGNILDKLLKHLASERYQSATEVLKDLNPQQASFSLPVVSTISPTLTPHQTQLLTTIPQSVTPGFPALEVFEFDTVTVDSTGREIKRDYRTANYYIEDLGNGVTMEMVAIPGGSFLMGASEEEGDADERPQHQVTVEPFL